MVFHLLCFVGIVGHLYCYGVRHTESIFCFCFVGGLHYTEYKGLIYGNQQIILIGLYMGSNTLSTSNINTNIYNFVDKKNIIFQIINISYTEDNLI